MSEVIVKTLLRAVKNKLGGYTYTYACGCRTEYDANGKAALGGTCKEHLEA